MPFILLLLFYANKKETFNDQTFKVILIKGISVFLEHGKSVQNLVSPVGSLKM